MTDQKEMFVDEEENIEAVPSEETREIIKTENEIVVGDDLSAGIPFNVAVSQAEQRVEVASKIIPLVLKSTLPTDWVNHSGNPWLTSGGIERVKRSLFQIDITDVKSERIMLADGSGGYFYKVQGKVTLKMGEYKVVQECIGACSSKDKFFGKKNGKWLPIEEVDEINIMRKAYTNFESNAISRILGLRGLTWDVLAQYNITPEKAATVEYKKDGGSSNPSKSELSKDAKGVLIQAWNALVVVADGDEEKAKELLMDITKSDDGKYKGITSLKRVKSEKQAYFINKQAKTLFEQIYNWDTFVKTGSVVEK
jgi:hypothetical protein